MSSNRVHIGLAAAAFACGVCATAMPGHAQDNGDEDPGSTDLAPRGHAGIIRYDESMDTHITTTYAGAGARVPGDLELDLSWEADAISSASVDVVTAATDAVDDLRNEFGLNARREAIVEDLDVNGGYAVSFERDSYSHIGHAGAQYSLLQKNLVVAVGYGLSYNRMGVRDEPIGSWRPLWVHSGDVGATYIIDPSTQVEFIYSAGFSHGYHANRYRRVPVTWRQDLRGAAWVEEAAPDQRVRNAFTLRGQRTIGEDLILSADYRLYFDTWGVVGHTATLGSTIELPANLSLRLRVRGAVESGADFYEVVYESLSEYRTRDRRLSPHLSGLAGLALTWNLGPQVGLENLELRAAVDGLVYRFDDYIAPSLDSFGNATWHTLGDLTGVVAQFGIGVRP